MSAGSSQPTSRYGRPPQQPADRLRFRFEIAVVGGEEGRIIRAAQARAIKELLEWIHQQDHPGMQPASAVEHSDAAHEPDYRRTRVHTAHR
jgi:hypothetical protein